MGVVFVKVIFEEMISSFEVGKRDINSLLETTPHGRIESPREVSGPQNKNFSFFGTNTLHLNQKFGLDSS